MTVLPISSKFSLLSFCFWTLLNRRASVIIAAIRAIIMVITSISKVVLTNIPFEGALVSVVVAVVEMVVSTLLNSVVVLAESVSEIVIDDVCNRVVVSGVMTITPGEDVFSLIYF